MTSPLASLTIASPMSGWWSSTTGAHVTGRSGWPAPVLPSTGTPRDLVSESPSG
jgi:hypothetical protein